MRLRSAMLLSAAVVVAGCASSTLPPQTTAERENQIETASMSAKAGDFERAERLMAPYLERDKRGELRLKSLAVSSASKKVAIDTTSLLLWDTGRDKTLEGFAKRYLSGYERDVTLCRLAERQGQYEQAYNCWNSLGDIDRARRVVRTDAAMRLLQD